MFSDVISSLCWCSRFIKDLTPLAANSLSESVSLSSSRTNSLDTIKTFEFKNDRPHLLRQTFHRVITQVT
jgi:hypothetical protein